MNYLLKTEPSEYSFADLQKDKTTIWDGVHNPVGRSKMPPAPNASRTSTFIPETSPTFNV
jgi:EVE domain-containing protein